MKILLPKALRFCLTPLVYKVGFFAKVKKQGLAKLALLVSMRLGWRLAVKILNIFGIKEMAKDALIAQLHAMEFNGNGKRENVFLNQQTQDIHGCLRKISKSLDTIIVGPWMSEVGFEVLYWIPFLHWVVEKYGIDTQQLLLVSRGGSQPWYGGLGKRYVDVFDILSQEEFRLINEERWRESRGQKQIRLTAAEHELLETIRVKEGLARIQLLHPSSMYWLFRSFWRGLDSYKFYQSFTRLRSFAVPCCDEEIWAQLPYRYIALRFYFRPSFPDTPQNREFITSLVKQISKNHDVVLLNPNIKMDDHHDFDCDNERIHTISHLMTPRNNLEIQSAVIRQAQAFIGTYGGLSYVAPFYGVPSLSFYSDAQHFLPVHLETAQRTFRELGVPFLAMHTSYYSLVENILGTKLCKPQVASSLPECLNLSSASSSEKKTANA